MKDRLTIEERVEYLRRGGYNPIHLWGNVYLLRYRSKMISDVPFYTVKIFRE